jgi:hypothetical protein
LRKNPIRADNAMLRPKLKAILSIPSRSFFFGKRAAMSVYPGKKSKKGRPITIRRTFEGKRVMIVISTMTRTFMNRMSLANLIFLLITLSISIMQQNFKSNFLDFTLFSGVQLLGYSGCRFKKHL